jgi:Zn-finger in Ran binding protein and others
VKDPAVDQASDEKIEPIVENTLPPSLDVNPAAVLDIIDAIALTEILPVVEPPISDGWDCPVCGISNLEITTVCVACDNPRNGTGESATGSLGWWCRFCTFVNPLAATR